MFCLMILASGSFDGLQETFWWLGVLGINPLEFPGRSAVVGASALGLILANVALIAVFDMALGTTKALPDQTQVVRIEMKLALLPSAISRLPMSRVT